MDAQSENSLDLVRCEVCGSVNRSLGAGLVCRRCHQPISHHSELSLDKSFALLIAAIIAYFPANLYPILINNKFGKEQSSTIVDGILLLWQQGAYPISLVVFFASVFIPVLKFALMGYLLISVQYAIGNNKSVNRGKLYLIAEVMGPWSMIDIFVVAILAGLIRLANIEVVPGPAATAFALSVLLTLLSARAFDTRLIMQRS